MHGGYVIVEVICVIVKTTCAGTKTRSAYKMEKFSNFPRGRIKRSDSGSSSVKEQAALSQLQTLLQTLHPSIPTLSPREVGNMLHDSTKLSQTSQKTVGLMKEVYGFSLALRNSKLEGGGSGVFVSSGVVPEGHIVGLYPGTVYLPFEPLFIQSLGNPFVFRCVDGWMIDGNHRGISKWIFKSCAYRDLIGPSLSCDLTWLSTNPINPLSIGQFVNNHTGDVSSNVEYVEVTIPATFPLSWWRFIPNVFYNVHNWDDTRLMRVVALATTQDVYSGEELYSSYLTLVSG